MSDLKTLLERADRAVADVPLPVGGLEGLEHRRDRRRRNQRIRAGVFGIAIAILAGWWGVHSITSSTPKPADERPVQDKVTTPPLPEPGQVVSSALAYGAEGDVFLADANGANAVKIADGEPDTSSECAPGEVQVRYTVNGTAWSPDGRYLAYWNWRPCPLPANDWGSVIITDAQGNVVTSFPAEGWAIAWSPDSTRVAVMDNWMPEAQELVTVGVYGLDGARQASLTVPRGWNPSGDYSPVWSRDGSSVMIPGVRLPLDGGAPTRLDLGEFYTGCCTYSPDGSRRAIFDGGALLVENTDTPDAEIGGAREFWQAAWSPNGELVAFEGDGGTQLLVRDVATGSDTVLADVKRPENVHVIEFSPDGDRIIFTRSDADASSLWSIGVDGSDLRQLVDGIEWADLRPQRGGEGA